MITIKQGDITNEDVEAIVNAANSGLRGGRLKEADLLKSARSFRLR
ncbi:MAG: hypothetical protein WC592_00875 [Candidatus Omnitrophota bacterium]